MSNQNESVLAEVIAASIGGTISASVLYPLEVLKTKLQAESKQNSSNTRNSNIQPHSGKIGDDDDNGDNAPSTTNTTQAPPLSATSYALTLYQTEGLKPFYSGITTSAFQSAAEKALYFFAYTGLKNLYSNYYHGPSPSSSSTTTEPPSPSPPMGTMTNLLLGCLAEWAHLPITLPIDCWTTRIQTSPTGSNETSFSILCTMLSDPQGLRGMYKGINAYVVLCLKPSIQYTVYERVKAVVLSSRREKGGGGGRGGNRGNEGVLTATEAFVLGMVARTIATVVCFPYLRAKVVMQSRSSSSIHNGDDGNDGDGRDGSGGTTSGSGGVSAMVGQMYRDGGLEEIFRGIGPELTRGVLSAALMMMVKEKIGGGVRAFLGVDRNR